MTDRKRYFSFLLRVWLAEEGSQPQWRASLENTHTGERLGFASLEDLFQYLKQPIQPAAGEKEANEEVKIKNKQGLFDPEQHPLNFNYAPACDYLTALP